MISNFNTAYSKYLKPELKKKVSFQLFRKINIDFIHYMVNRIMNGHRVYLPSHMGSMAVRGKKPYYSVKDGVIKGLAPDWVSTKKFRDANPGSKKVIFHTNAETDGIRYKWMWYTTKAYCGKKKNYYFRLSRHNKRKLSSLIKEGNIEYFIADEVLFGLQNSIKRK